MCYLKCSKNKGADQLHSFCTAWFVSDLVGSPECLFSHDTAHSLWVPIRIFLPSYIKYMLLALDKVIEICLVSELKN